MVITSVQSLTDDSAICVDQQGVLLAVTVHVHTVRRVDAGQRRPATDQAVLKSTALTVQHYLLKASYRFAAFALLLLTLAPAGV